MRRSPVGNTNCSAAAQRYRECLTDARSFDARALDEVVQADPAHHRRRLDRRRP